MKETCIFCRIISGELPASVVYEDSEVLALMDIQPINRGHILVMPKKCYQTLQEMPLALAEKVMRIVVLVERNLWQIEGLRCEGTNILQNNGRTAWQEVEHVHFHIIPRYKGDSFKIQFTPKKVSRGELDKLAGLVREQLS